MLHLGVSLPYLHLASRIRVEELHLRDMFIATTTVQGTEEVRLSLTIPTQILGQYLGMTELALSCVFKMVEKCGSLGGT